MFSMRTLLLIVLIGITSVLAAPTLSGRAESSQDPVAKSDDEDTGTPLADSQALLTGDWDPVPPPSDVVSICSQYSCIRF